MTVKPPVIALFTGLVLLGLLGLTLLAGDDGFHIGTLRIKYPTADKFLAGGRKSPTVGQDSLKLALEAAERRLDEDSIAIIKPCDTCPAAGLSNAPAGFHFDADGTGAILKIEMPAGNPHALDAFFEDMESAAAQKKKIRILHYGDSQIEGDRITSHIRQRLQHMFGGNGPGFLPIMPVYEQIAADITYSPNWERFASFDPARRSLDNRKFGVFMSFTRFTSAPVDTSASGTTNGSAWVQVGQSRKASGNARYFKQVSLHYGNLHTPLLMQVFDGDSLIVSDTLLRDGKYHAYTLNFAKTPQALRYVFTGEESADFYGFTLDGGYGLSVDNIAMRGATGTHFNSTDFALNAEMAAALNVKLLILQYGGNTVPYLKDEQGIDTYVRQLRAQLRNLRKYNDGVPMIFIGPADMATRIDGAFASYPLLEPLIAALRSMCQELNIPYWDTYKAMGGKDAILAWAERDLVAADYVHFSYKGTRIIAEQFVNALLFEYQQYKAGSM